MKPILILEDSSNDCELLKFALRTLGVTNPICAVPTVSEAIAYLEGAAPYEDRARFPLPVILFVDLKLPEVDGFRFLKWFGAHPQAHDTFVVVVTGAEDVLSFRRACALGAHAYLNKSSLRPEVERLLKEFPFYWIRKAEEVSQS